MTHLDEVRAALVARLSAVLNVGVVHPYQRYAASLTALRELYVADIAGEKQLRGWYVSRVATSETSPVAGTYAVTHDWVFRGYMALDDGAQSEIAFDNLVEAVRDAFRGEDDLAGAVGTTVFAGPGNGGDERAGPQVPEIGPVMFGGVLCHAARIAISTRTYFKA